MPEKCSACGTVGDVEITREPGRLVKRCLVCGHLTYVFVDSTVTHDVLGVVKLDPNPIILLRKMMDGEDYFKAIIVAAAYLENYGIVKLLNYQKSLGITIELKKLKRLQLGEIILFLHGSNLIDQATYTKMFQVKNVRDDLAHEPEYSLDEKRAIQILNKAIECLESLSPLPGSDKSTNQSHPPR